MARTRKKWRNKISKKLLVKLFALAIVSYALLVTVRQVQESILFTRDGRINILFFSERPTLVSLGFEDDVDYLATFDNGSMFVVPGGYGNYRLGGLGRLAELEKKPDLVSRTFGWATSTFIDYFIYPKDPKVYRTLESESGSTESLAPQLSLSYTFLSRDVETNASILDRIFLYFALVKRGKKTYEIVNTNMVSKVGENTLFDYEAFVKDYQGFFYERVFRQEGADVKIVYEMFTPAETISRILEGEGIRVVDLEPVDEGIKTPTVCTLQVNKGTFKRTVHFLKRAYGCQVREGVSNEVDIVMILGKRLESEWE